MKNKLIFKSYLVLIFLTVVFFSNELCLSQTIKVKGVQYIPDIEILFSDGMKKYKNGQFEKAKETFYQMTHSYPAHQRVTISYLMLGSCYYELGDFRESLNLMNELIRKYPGSNYLYDAKYIKGYSHYKRGEFKKSLSEFLSIADNSKKSKLVEKSQNIALKIIDNNITLRELEEMSDIGTGKISAAIITIKTALKYLNIGKRHKTISLLQNFIKQYPNNPYNSYIKELLNKKNIPMTGAEIKVGVILPISGEYAEQARGVLAGISYAQKKYNESSNIHLELVVKDSQGDIAKVVKETRELASDNKIVAIIGELERDKTIAIAAVLDRSNIPLVTPTTSGHGVTTLNDYTFQVNSDIETRGRKLAEYAIQDLGLKTFATLSPTDDYGRQMTDSFCLTVENLGGTVVTQKWYYPGTEDVGRQFKAIREVGFSMMNRDSLIKYYTKDMNEIQERRFDEEEIPVTSIDGVFLPCYTEEMKFIGPQFAYVNVKSQLFGGEYWYEPEELRKVEKYVDGIIFCSGYFINDTDHEFISFKNDFRQTMKRSPDVMELYGFDAMNVLIEAISHNSLTREDVANYLRKLENFHGIRGSVSLNQNNRVNSDVRLLSYKNRRIELVK